MPIVHCVMTSFKADVPVETVNKVNTAQLALKQNCKHPETGKPYILSFEGGKENSPEGLQRGVKYVFVTHFDKEEDRAYYLEKDPAHLDFMKMALPYFEVAQVCDFTPGVF